MCFYRKKRSQSILVFLQFGFAEFVDSFELPCEDHIIVPFVCVAMREFHSATQSMVRDSTEIGYCSIDAAMTTTGIRISEALILCFRWCEH